MCGASAFVGLQPCEVPLHLVNSAVSAQRVHVVVHAKLPSREFCSEWRRVPLSRLCLIRTAIGIHYEPSSHDNVMQDM